MQTVTPEIARPDWLPDREFPFRIRSLRVGGNTVAYLDEGSGPPLLFVHSGPAWMFVFRDLILALREDFRCLALDLPGAGLSPPPGDGSGSLDLRTAAEVLEGFVTGLGLTGAVVVAHDLGAPLSAAVLARHPGRFAGMVVTEGFGWSLVDHDPKVARILRVVGSRGMRAMVAATNAMHRFTSTGLGTGRNLSRAGRRAFRGPYRERRARAQALLLLRQAGFERALFDEADRGLRARPDLPMLMVFGEKSPALKEGFPDGWRERVPGAELLVVANGHHFPMADDPTGVAERIREWHRRLPAKA